MIFNTRKYMISTSYGCFQLWINMDVPQKRYILGWNYSPYTFDTNTQDGYESELNGGRNWN